jgi:hypothetical protein
VRGWVWPARIDRTGQRGPTRGEAAHSGWRRSSHGFYVPASVADAPPEQRIVEAGALLPSFGGVTGWASLRWQGAHWFSGIQGDQITRKPVILAISWRDVRPQPGIGISHEQLRPSDIVVVDGLAVTIAARSALFEMRYAPSVAKAVVVADMAMHADLVSHDELTAYAATLGTWTGIPQARKALTLARENSWSPQETRLRLLWADVAGLPEPMCNPPVFDRSGRHVGTPDLLDPVAGVAAEYEGVLHLDRRRRGIDVRREQEFKDLGIEMTGSTSTGSWLDSARRMRAPPCGRSARGPGPSNLRRGGPRRTPWLGVAPSR